MLGVFIFVKNNKDKFDFNGLENGIPTKLIPHHAELDRYTRTFLYVKSNYTFEKNIANYFFSNFKYETGKDRRTIAEAFHLLNLESKHNHGIILKKVEFSDLNALDLSFKATVDPTFHNARANYTQLQLTSGHIVRIPNEAYIEHLRKN
ncbi:hypothetical protein BWK58_14220 [Flavobacterium columnare]|nr:hypothetical protein BWK58_14220 [Flavobacterium columnare]